MITLPKAEYDRMLEEASLRAPEEACGLIGGHLLPSGRESNPSKEIVRVYVLENLDHSPEHFTLDPREQLAAIKDMRANGLVPLGNWHSHPETPSRPSDEDKRLAFDSRASYLILSLQDAGHPVLHSFHIEGVESSREELYVTESDNV